MEDNPEATLARNHAAIARIAALAPVNADAAELAAQCIAARARARASRAALRAPASRFQPLTPSPNPDTAHPCRFAAKTGQQSGCHFNFATGGVILILRRHTRPNPGTVAQIGAVPGLAPDSTRDYAAGGRAS